MNIPIVYEDEYLMALDKPPGLLVIPSPRKDSRTLTGLLNEDLQKKGIPYRLHPCHRLDRETSGLIIYAKGKSIQKKMMEEFKLKKVKKTYIAFVAGVPFKLQADIKNPIEGVAALTKYKVIEKRKDFAIVEVNPLTGRTNQIRIHFKEIGHPILGETKYAFRRDFLIKAKRLCLHAKGLEFTHPVRKDILSLHVDLPKDLKEFLDKHTTKGG
ncbi:MAG: RluA family pseudouridine synthase [Candidatus Omnitrophota bacterium]